MWHFFKNLFSSLDVKSIKVRLRSEIEAVGHFLDASARKAPVKSPCTARSIGIAVMSNLKKSKTPTSRMYNCKNTNDNSNEPSRVFHTAQIPICRGFVDRFHRGQHVAQLAERHLEFALSGKKPRSAAQCTVLLEEIA